MVQNKRLDLPIGTEQIIEGKLVKVVYGWGCDKCPLHDTKSCEIDALKCFHYQRADGKTVHFEEVDNE